MSTLVFYYIHMMMIHLSQTPPNMSSIGTVCDSLGKTFLRLLVGNLGATGRLPVNSSPVKVNPKIFPLFLPEGNAILPMTAKADFGVWFFQFLSVSVHLCLYLSVSICFCPFFPVSVHFHLFCLFSSVSFHFCLFLSVSVPFCPFLSVLPIYVNFFPFLFLLNLTKPGNVWKWAKTSSQRVRHKQVFWSSETLKELKDLDLNILDLEHFKVSDDLVFLYTLYYQTYQVMQWTAGLTTFPEKLEDSMLFRYT